MSVDPLNALRRSQSEYNDWRNLPAAGVQGSGFMVLKFEVSRALESSDDGPGMGAVVVDVDKAVRFAERDLPGLVFIVYRRSETRNAVIVSISVGSHEACTTITQTLSAEFERLSLVARPIEST